MGSLHLAASSLSETHAVPKVMSRFRRVFPATSVGLSSVSGRVGEVGVIFGGVFQPVIGGVFPWPKAQKLNSNLRPRGGRKLALQNGKVEGSEVGKNTALFLEAVAWSSRRQDALHKLGGANDSR